MDEVSRSPQRHEKVKKAGQREQGWDRLNRWGHPDSLPNWFGSLRSWLRLCPAGRAHCAWSGHFVACISCLVEADCVGPPVGRRKDCPDRLTRSAELRWD